MVCPGGRVGEHLNTEFPSAKAHRSGTQIKPTPSLSSSLPPSPKPTSFCKKQQIPGNRLLQIGMFLPTHSLIHSLTHSRAQSLIFTEFRYVVHTHLALLASLSLLFSHTCTLLSKQKNEAHNDTTAAYTRSNQ